MSKKPKRARTARREADRAVERHLEGATKLAALERGGAPARPIELTSASQVEPDASGFACPACGGTVRVEDHEAERHGTETLRVARVICRQCHRRWSRYYRLAAALPN